MSEGAQPSTSRCQATDRIMTNMNRQNMTASVNLTLLGSFTGYNMHINLLTT